MQHNIVPLKLQLHDAIYRLRFYLNSLIHILSLSNSHNNVASIQKNRGDKSHRVIVALIGGNFSFKCGELSSGSLKALLILPLLASYKISSLATTD